MSVENKVNTYRVHFSFIQVTLILMFKTYPTAATDNVAFHVVFQIGACYFQEVGNHPELSLSARSDGLAHHFSH